MSVVKYRLLRCKKKNCQVPFPHKGQKQEKQKVKCRAIESMEFDFDDKGNA